MEDGSCTTEHVERHPGITELTTQRPAPRHIINGSEGHDQGGDEQVGNGERRYKVVCDVDTQMTLDKDRHHNEHIADDRRHGDQSQQL